VKLKFLSFECLKYAWICAPPAASPYFHSAVLMAGKISECLSVGEAAYCVCPYQVYFYSTGHSIKNYLFWFSQAISKLVHCDLISIKGRDFSFGHSFQNGLGVPTCLVYLVQTAGGFHGVKQTEREADCLSLMSCQRLGCMELHQYTSVVWCIQRIRVLPFIFHTVILHSVKLF